MSAASSQPSKPSAAATVSQLLQDFQAIQFELEKALLPDWGGVFEPDPERYRELLGQLQERVEEMKNATEELHQRYLNSQTRFQNVLKADGSIWMRPTALPSSKIPRFCPVEERPTSPNGGKTRVVSFINLKGGVGKTTLTANLVAAFAAGNFSDLGGRRGRPARVLVADLDFQGTLSQRCAENSANLQNAYNKNLTSTQLLRKKGKFTLEELSLPFVGAPFAALIPANEGLDEQDVRRLNELAGLHAETRYYYRQWFHRSEVFEQYDFIFFDCPPRLTASSVCALVASDFVFIPTAPESFDVNSVHRTLNWLGKTRQNLFLPVQFGGAILNRTNNENGLTSLEEKNKSKIKLACDDFRELFSDSTARSAVLDAFIPRRTGGNYINGVDGKSLPYAQSSHFNNLATEIYRRTCQ